MVGFLLQRWRLAVLLLWLATAGVLAYVVQQNEQRELLHEQQQAQLKQQIEQLQADKLHYSELLNQYQSQVDKYQKQVEEYLSILDQYHRDVLTVNAKTNKTKERLTEIIATQSNSCYSTKLDPVIIEQLQQYAEPTNSTGDNP